MLFSNRYQAAMARKLEPLLAPAASCLVLVLLFLAFPAQGQAHTVTTGPSFEVKAGFETRYRDGNWVPVQVTLRNGGPEFSGTLSLSASASQLLGQNNSTTPSNYQAPVTLATGAQKQVTMETPAYVTDAAVE